MADKSLQNIKPFCGRTVQPNRNEDMPDNDLQLVQQLQAGNQNAFEQLVLKYQKRIYNLAYKMIRDTEEAKDLAQDIFVKAYRGLKKFKAESSFYTWLYQIALNACINYTRSRRWKNLVSIFEVKEPVAERGNPAGEVERDSVNQAIDQAILSLPAKQRSVFILRHYEELPYQEISRITGTSPGALKANYFQAVKKLQKKLAYLR